MLFDLDVVCLQEKTATAREYVAEKEPAEVETKTATERETANVEEKEDKEIAEVVSDHFPVCF